MTGLTAAKVLFLCPSLAGAGVERRVCIMLDHFDCSRYDIHLGLLRREGQFLTELSSTPVHYVEPPLGLKWVFRWLPPLDRFVNVLASVYQQWRLLHSVSPDLVVTFTIETSVPFALINPTRRRKNIRWVISEDSNTPEATFQRCKKGALADAMLALLGGAYRKADCIAAVSPTVKDSLRTHYRIPDRKMVVIANPIEQDRILKKIAHRPSPEKDAPFLLAAGRLVRVKRFDLLLKAFATVRKNRAIKLILLGEGPEKSALTRLADRLGIAEDVTFTGFVSNPWAYMRHAQMLLLTSRTEGFGNVLIEAMASGCPVVSTASGGPNDIIIHDHNGVLVHDSPDAIAAAILTVLDDRAKREALIRAARSGLDKYCPHRICGEFSRLFDGLLVPIEGSVAQSY